MAEENKPAEATMDEPVARLLELQSKYGMDQETMLIYMSFVNLMSILNLMGRRYGGSLNSPLHLPVPLTPGDGPSLDNLATMLKKMLGGQSGSSMPGEQGINPAMLMSLLNAIGGQNMDLGGLVNMLAGLIGTGVKQAPKPALGDVTPAVSTSEAVSFAKGTSEVGSMEKNAGGETAARREVPKIMKWDYPDERKKT